jgi:CheY-like chemotaxis protein
VTYNKAMSRLFALTAGTVIGEKEKCLEAGMDDYVSKPIVKQTLEEVVAKWIDPSRSIKNEKESIT